MFRLVFAVLVLLWTLPAAAEDLLVGTTCQVNADCPADFICEETERPCAVPEPMDACVCVDCPPGHRCPPCACEDDEGHGPIGGCEPETELRCVFHPASCTDDADCSRAGFRCYQNEICEGSGCFCPPCVDGDCEPCDCEDEPEEHCEVIGGYCMPDEEATCGSDADCAAGWECMEGIGGGASDCACECYVCEGPGCVDDEPICECDHCEEEHFDDDEGICLPPGWTEQVASWLENDWGGTPGGANDEYSREGQSQNASDDGGSTNSCSAAGGGPLPLLALGALVALRRRR